MSTDKKTPPQSHTPLHLGGNAALDYKDTRRRVYQKVFSGEDGRTVLADIIGRFGLAAPALRLAEVGNQDAGNLAIFRSGMQHAAFEIMMLAGAVPDSLPRAIVADKMEDLYE